MHKLIKSNKLKVALENHFKNNRGDMQIAFTKCDLVHCEEENNPFDLMPLMFELAKDVVGTNQNLYWCCVTSENAFYIMAGTESEAVKKVNSW